MTRTEIIECAPAACGGCGRDLAAWRCARSAVIGADITLAAPAESPSTWRQRRSARLQAVTDGRSRRM